MHDQDFAVSHPWLKLITLWLTTLTTSLWTTFSTIHWDKLAQFAAFIYSLVLLVEWARKQLAKRRDTSGSD